MLNLNFKKILLSACLLFTPSFVHSQSDSYAIRQAIKSYQLKDYELAKKISSELLEKENNESYKPFLLNLLADVFFEEKNFKRSLYFYNLIEDQKLQKESLIQKLTCLYYLKSFAKLYELTAFELTQNEFSSESEKEQIMLFNAESQLNLNKDLELAKATFSKLLKSPLKANALLSLSQLTLLEKDFKEAKNYLNQTINFFPNRKNELLYLIANVEASTSPQKALECFNQIRDMPNELQSDAQYKYLCLLFDSKDYKQLIQESEKVKKSLTKDQMQNLHYYKACAHYHLNQFDLAYLNFNSYLKSKESKKHQLDAHYYSLSCLQQLNRLEKQDYHIKYLKGSPSFPKALFLKALTLKKNSKYLQAYQTLKQINTADETIKHQVSMQCYDCLKNLNDYLKLREEILFSIENSQADSRLFSYLLLASSNLKESDPTNENKLNYISDLTFSLENSDLFSKENEAEVYFQIATLYLEQNNKQEARNYLNRFCIKFLDHPLELNAHLLLSEIYQDSELYSESSIKEELIKAQKLAFTQEQKAQVYGSLFNFYSSKESREDEQLAASALFEAVTNKLDTPQENLLWLYNYYVANHDTKKALETYQWFDKASLKKEDLYALEFSYAKCLGELQKNDEKISLLKKLEAKLEPENSLFSYVLYEEAQSHLKLDKEQKALSELQKLISKQHYCPSELLNESLLKFSKLSIRLALLENSTEKLEHIEPLLQQILVSRNIEKEPLFLQTALSLVYLQSIKDFSQKNYSLIAQRLLELKSQFNSVDNLKAKSYHQKRLENPQINWVYESYMTLIDAKIAHMQAKDHFLKAQPKIAREKLKIAKNLLQTLKNSSQDLTNELKHQVTTEESSIKSSEISPQQLSLLFKEEN